MTSTDMKYCVISKHDHADIKKSLWYLSIIETRCLYIMEFQHKLRVSILDTDLHILEDNQITRYFLIDIIWWGRYLLENA